MKIATIIAFLLLNTHLIYSQNSTSTSGGDASGSGGSSSYSVGQLTYITKLGGGTVMEGVQQSFELLTLSTTEITTLDLTLLAYPNPTNDNVKLVLKNSDLTALNYTMYDLQGRIVLKGNVEQVTTFIDMRTLASGIYILKLSQRNQELKTLKIIKK